MRRPVAQGLSGVEIAAPTLVYTCLVRTVQVLLVCVGGGLASAQPSQRAEPSQEIAECKARRHELTVAAMQIGDLQERGRRLSALPDCSGDAKAEAPPTIPVPLDPHLAVTATLGLGTWTFSDALGEPTGSVPSFEIAAGMRFYRSLSILAFVGATTVPVAGVDAYQHPYPVTAPPPPYMFTNYSGTEKLLDLGVRVTLERGPLVFSGALGAETDHSTGYAPLFGDIGQTFTRALVEADMGYNVHIDRMTAQALLIASDANGSWLGGNGNTTSLRLALRIGL